MNIFINILVRIIILANGIIIFFFFQFILYGVISYFYYLKQKRKHRLTKEYILKLSKQKKISPPYITIIIPAKDEKLVIGSTIDRFMKLDYFKERFSLLIVLDDKELFKPFEETTHSEVYEKQQYYNKLYGREIIVSTSVPINYDGEFKGKMLNTEVPSNKPRALNWALNFIPEQTNILGFYDADSQPETTTLLYVAYKYITKKENEKILLQGPVVQVRNYFYLKPFNKIYALAQAITHEWYLPALLFHLPFIGGTNFFIEKDLLYKIKGFNKDVLSEDLELGCRLYIETNTWPEFMPYISTEQTPPSYKSYFKQRTRWASGYIQVLKSLLNDTKFFKRKFFISCVLIFYGILPWFAAQILALTSVGILIFSISGLSYLFKFLPSYVKLILIFMNLGYIIFLLYYFNYALRKIYVLNHEETKLILEYLNFLLLPLAAVAGTVPYTYGFITSLFKNGNFKREKTIRTQEK